MGPNQAVKSQSDSLSKLVLVKNNDHIMTKRKPCFRCKESFIEESSLFIHLKSEHGLTIIDLGRGKSPNRRRRPNIWSVETIVNDDDNYISFKPNANSTLN